MLARCGKGKAKLDMGGKQRPARAKEAERAMVVMRVRGVIERTVAAGYLEVVSNALDGAQRHKVDRLWPRIGEERPRRVQRDREDGEPVP